MNSVFKLTVLFSLCTGLLAITGCQPKSVPQHQVIAVVSVEPHAFLAERIGAERVHVEVLVPAGKEPETYQVTPDKLVVFSNAQVYFRTGMPVEESLLPKLLSLSKNLHVVDLRSGLPLRKLEIHQHDEHRPSERDHAHHDQMDPHIWFAPTLLKTEAELVFRTLQQCDPDGSALYQKNYEQVLQEIETIRNEISATLSSSGEAAVFVFHPSYGYFCEEFGLRQWAIEYEGKSPKPQQIAELIEQAKRGSGTPKIFIQPEFSQSAALAIAETIGAKVQIHSTLERDVLQSMLRFAQLVAE